MKQMDGYKTMLARLNALIDALEKGELSLDELGELEKVTRNLHERSIILRYNAFKEMVLPNDQVSAEPEVIIEPDPIPEPEVESEPEEDTPFDFSIFEEETKEEEVTEESEKIEQAPVAEAIPAAEPEVESDPEPIPEPEIIEEPVVEEPVVETPSKDVETSGNDFLDRLKLPESSLAGRFGAGKLTTLIGAFGLNERLRFINDLFDGSSESFSDALKALDSQNDLDTARQKAATYAEEHEWDPEEEVVIEFMTYLSRRYA